MFFFFIWIHIVLAIVAVGANITYAIWIQRATITDKGVLPFTLRGIKLIDDRVSTPAYLLIMLTGLLMVLNAEIPLTESWLLLALILWAILFLTSLFGYTPTLRKQIALVESEGPDSEAYRAVANRGMVIGIILGVIVLVIIYLMVFQPVLWG